MAESRIDAIIPTYNCCAYLGEAIESALSQTRPPDEIIVVDDGSTDGTAELVQNFGSSVRYVYQQNSGISAARNKGLSLVSGKFIAFLDADDLWTPRKLELQKAFLDQNPDTDMVFGLVSQFISPDIDPEIAKQWECPTDAREGVVAVTMVARRSVFAKAGYFNEAWQVGEFMDWYARTRELGLKAHMLKDVLTLRRIHGENTGIRQANLRKDYARILKASLDRRRGEFSRRGQT